ncbi:DUF1566 domain-containing protein [Flavobacterium sediminilitoris]|uniref:DUF1566 domain-containing protein n=1 Tax=Flavobacterium sediminilitoris TaxID=2024526 RepID=A0ABY4HIQ5_9FLAO|nr:MULTISPECIES: DUF1566 domain-containing protein [Flavobacterium]UOX32715.1 DUF1566 domain-containing protein [Flavobacterium sediminilitoris]
MKKIFKIKSLVAVASLLFVIGCSSDDDVNDQPNNPITVQDFSATVDENPTNGQSLGIVQASSNETLTYSISTSTPLNALSIDVNTGELTVADETLFDYEINTEITATITVENSMETENLAVTINLTNVNEIGDYNYGGVIFWVNATGDEGLVCAINDEGTAEWGCASTDITGANGTVIGTGEANTLAIIADCSTIGTAADLVSNSTLNTFNDWFLPSRDEIHELYMNRVVVNNTISLYGGTLLNDGLYWSSSQNNPSSTAWYRDFSTGQVSTDYKAAVYKVRAVRAWTEF